MQSFAKTKHEGHRNVTTDNSNDSDSLLSSLSFTELKEYFALFRLIELLISLFFNQIVCIFYHISVPIPKLRRIKYPEFSSIAMILNSITKTVQ